jgi:hypothetical protein
MTVPKYYFPEDIWNIIKEYNGIIGWEKPIIDFLNKPSYKDLDDILAKVEILGFDNWLHYFSKCYFYRRKAYKSISQCRKLLIQMFFKTRPSKPTILELYKKYLDKLFSSTFRVGDNIIYWNDPTSANIRATVIKVNRVSMNVKLDDGREIRILGIN